MANIGRPLSTVAQTGQRLIRSQAHQLRKQEVLITKQRVEIRQLSATIRRLNLQVDRLSNTSELSDKDCIVCMRKIPQMRMDHHPLTKTCGKECSKEHTKNLRREASKRYEQSGRRKQLQQIKAQLRGDILPGAPHGVG